MKKILKVMLASFIALTTVGLVKANTTSGIDFPYETEHSVKLNKSTWTAVADSYHNKSGNTDGPASNLLDGNKNSFWHTAYNENSVTPLKQVYPYNVRIKFSDNFDALTFGAFSYTTRTDSATNGDIARYELYISDANEELAVDDGKWIKINSGSFTQKGTTKVELDSEYTATQLKFVALSAQNGSSHAGGAEFDLYSERVRKPLDHSNFELSVLGSEETSQDGSNADKPGKTDSNSLKAILFDGSLTNYWQSSFQDPMTPDTSFLKIDLHNNYFIDRVDLSKRYHAKEKYNCTGNMDNAIIQTSLDGTTWTTVFEGNTPHLSTDISAATTKIVFDMVKARYIRISSTKSYHWQAANKNKIMCLSEVKVYGSVENEVNLAKKQNVSFSIHNPDGTPGAYSTDRPLSLLNNTDTNKDNYVDIHGTTSNPRLAYLQTDLGELCMINSIKMYRYTDKTYPNTVILVSDTKDFANYTVVYNTDADNIHGFGSGSDTPEVETANGKVYANNLPAKGRYIRIYSNGTAGSNDNHVTELEVYGSVILNLHTTFATALENNGALGVVNTDFVPESVYADESGKVVYTSDMTGVNPLRKYVTKKALSVKAQTNHADGRINVRFVSSVTSLNLETVKFKIELLDENNEQTKVYITPDIDKVYRRIYSDFGHELVNANEIFENDASTSFFAYKLNNVPVTYTGKIRVTPYWVPLNEETLVEGVARTFVVSGETLVDAK